MAGSWLRLVLRERNQGRLLQIRMFGNRRQSPILEILKMNKNNNEKSIITIILGIRKWRPGLDSAEMKLIGTEDQSHPLSSFTGDFDTVWISGPVTATRNQF